MFPFSLSSDFKGATTDILHYYSMAHTEEPLPPLCEQVHTKWVHRYSFHHGIDTRYTAAVLPFNSCKCAEFLSTDKIPRQARPVEQIKHHYLLIAPEKCTEVPICWTTFPPQPVELCNIRAGRTTTFFSYFFFIITFTFQLNS